MEFSKTGYQTLLETALDAGYRFIPFDNTLHLKQGRCCLLRHDVDVDLGAALEIAKVESVLGIRSTFFLMLRSPLYNLIGRANSRIVQEIIQLGHWIGLHYDDGFCLDKQYSLDEWICLESRILENMFGVEIKAVSFHQPSQAILSGKIKLNNYVNTYNKKELDGFYYVSDSNKVWKVESPYNIFQKELYSKVHLLIHPLWWIGDYNLPTEDVWEQMIVSNFYRSQKQLLETERAYGPAREITISKASVCC